MFDSIISVIMRTYNSDFGQLEDAVNSIIEQTYQNWEFIICDDGFSNGTYEWLCDKYLHDERFII